MDAKIRTLLLDFRLPSADWSKASLALVQQKLITPLQLHAFQGQLCLDAVYSSMDGAAIKSVCFADPDSNVFLTIRLYPSMEEEGLVPITLSMEMTQLQYHRLQDTYDAVPEEAMRALLRKHVSPEAPCVTFMPALKRCLKDSPYLRTSDNRIVEYSFREVLFSDYSQFQQVQIVDTLDFGRLLLLDEMTNLAESDTVQYTHALMNLPQESYKDKRVLILGGGDGGLLKELLELPSGQGPEFVTMVDIDEMVLDACARFMPSVSGGLLLPDKRSGARHLVITGDAIHFMKECLDSGTRFDTIFGDLTDVPVSNGPRDADLWLFLKTIISLALKLLQPDTGRFLTHCSGLNADLRCYEEMLRSLGCSFTKTSCFVNSFMETWLFYQVQPGCA